VVVPFDKAREAGVMIVGTGAQVSDILNSQVERSGCNYLMLNFTFGSLSAAESLDSINRFADSVMPTFARGPRRLDIATGA